MVQRFENPSENLSAQDTYGLREVGIPHPDMPSFIRLNDAGDIEIVANDGCAIVLHAKTKSVTIVADTIKFLTKEGDSIRWNNSNLNSKASDFTQPALIPLDVKELNSLYEGSDYYYGDPMEEDE